MIVRDYIDCAWLLLIRLNRFLKIEKIEIDLIDLNRFKSIFCDFLRFFHQNQIWHRQKAGEDLEDVPLSHENLCERVSLLDTVESSKTDSVEICNMTH